jgi:SAM-dependent methyltransferase
VTHRFDRFARDYERHLDRSISVSGEGSEYFTEYKARYLAALLPPGFGGKILDFGCGAGLLARFLRQAIPKAVIYGYDESAEMTREARRRLDSGVFTTDRGELGSDYDLIVAANVLHHVDRDGRAAVVAEMRERLGPAGRLAIFEHNPVNPLTRWAVSRCPFDQGVQLLPPAETRRYLTGAGLGSIRVEYIVFFPRALGWCRRWEPRLWWCPLGAQYVALAWRGR